MKLIHQASALVAGIALFSSAATAQVVINEIVYDAAGSDDGQTFVEVFGPAGFDVSGYTLQSIEGRGGSASNCNNESFTFPAGTLIPGDGFLVVADELGSTGTTMVANADFIVGDMDPENGGDAFQLLDASGNYVDAVAYGSIDMTMAASACNGQTWFEGVPARDVFAPLSIERCPAGSDTDDNGVDFRGNVPTPGAGESCCTAIEWVSQGSGNSISASLGESVGLDFWASPCGNNQSYVILSALTDPAMAPPPAPFPVLDPFTPVFLGVTSLNVAPFIAWSGTLDGLGESIGTAALDFSATPVVGLTQFDLYVGAVAFDAQLNIFGTNSVVLTVEM